MKIVIINGSPRKNGATSKVLKSLNEILNKNYPEVIIEFVNLIDCNIKYCMGCKVCYKTGKCVIENDNVETIHDIIRESDGIIIGSPTYASNVSGLYKNFHDRVHMTMEQLLYNKPCINITTYENAMGNKTIKIMKEMVMNAGGYNIGSLVIKNTFNHDPVNEKFKIKAERIVEKIIGEINKKRIPLFSKIYTTVAVNLFIKRFVYKDRENNQGIINSLKEKKII
jgi:multimeric flavodoxin WrbA